MPPSSRLPSHLPGLDGVRGVAILLVLFHQYLVIEGDGLLVRVVSHALDVGWIGVQLFFVLSGFLITGILLDTRGEPHAYRRFLVRRALRIFPLYYGLLVVLTLLLPLLGIDAFADQRLAYWIFTSNWEEMVHGGPLPHLWSLAVEEQFYLLWPLAALILSTRRLLLLCIAVVAVGIAVRVFMLLQGDSPMHIYLSSFARMGALASGGAVAAWVRMPPGQTLDATQARRTWLFILAIALVGSAIPRFITRTGPTGQTLGYTWLSCLFALAIWAVAVMDARQVSAPLVGMLRARWLRTIGKYSFAMYLFHKPLHDTIGVWALAHVGYNGGVAGGLAYTAAMIAVTALLGALSYHGYEKHFLELRRRLPGARPGGLPG